MTIANLRSGDVFTAQFNPEEIERQVGVNYTRLTVLGLSHEVLQFQNRANEKLKFKLYFDKRATTEAAELVEKKAAERQLDALTVGSKKAQDIAGGGPPDALFEFGEHFLLRVRVLSLKYQYKRFSFDGTPIHFSVDVEIEEIRDKRLYAEDVLTHGLQRE